jgi:hypothetical protein
VHVQRNDVQDDLQEGFDPAPLPPIGPDGALELEPPRKMPDPPPRMCEAGPCVNYHRFEIQFDVTRPIAERVEEGGKLVGAAPPMPFHVRVFHYCYPTVGVETDLGDMPVLSCNRWEPISALEREDKTRVEDEFFASEDGKSYKTALDTWLANQKREQDETESIAVAGATQETP